MASEGTTKQKTSDSAIFDLDELQRENVAQALSNLDATLIGLKKLRKIMVELQDDFTRYSTELELMLEELDAQNE